MHPARPLSRECDGTDSDGPEPREVGPKKHPGRLECRPGVCRGGKIQTGTMALYPTASILVGTSLYPSSTALLYIN